MKIYVKCNSASRETSATRNPNQDRNIHFHKRCGFASDDEARKNQPSLQIISQNWQGWGEEIINLLYQRRQKNIKLSSKHTHIYICQRPIFQKHPVNLQFRTARIPSTNSNILQHEENPKPPMLCILNINPSAIIVNHLPRSN